MPAKVSRLLVIDASVARAAGDLTATDPVARECRDFLRAVLTICHRLVLTDEIAAEWNKHQSRFAKTWRASMMARRKIVRVVPAHDSVLQNKVASFATKDAERAAMMKDWLLIEAAFAAEQVVISRDDTVYNLFVATAGQVGELRAIVWANPCVADDDCLSWLENGAQLEKHRHLGYQEP